MKVYIVLDTNVYTEDCVCAAFDNKEAANKYALCNDYPLENIVEVELNNGENDEREVGAEYRFSSLLGYDDALYRWSGFCKHSVSAHDIVEEALDTSYPQKYYVTVFIPLKLQKYDDETLERVLKENEDIAFEKANKLFKEYRESHK